jgi:hypothetical protein
VLDAALVDLMDRHGLPPRHAIRERRNDVAHGFAGEVDWLTLASDTETIQTCLEVHEYVGPRPLLAPAARRPPLAGTCKPFRAGAPPYVLIV